MPAIKSLKHKGKVYFCEEGDEKIVQLQFCFVQYPFENVHFTSWKGDCLFMYVIKS